ncbi:MAG: hypothetical protein ACM3N4_02585, partial [Nitrososphaerota archaeon]
YLVALLTLDRAAVREWATGNGLDVSDLEKLAQSPELRAYLDEQMTQVNAKLQIFERVKSYDILIEEFSQENNLLTPTQKIRRKEITERFRSRFEQLYEAAPSGERAATKNGRARSARTR